MPNTSSKPLAGATVLITRPVGQGRTLARRVRALGGWPLLLPGVSLRAAEPAPLDALKAALEGDLALFTSPAAARFAARLAPLRGRARIAAVGRGTAHVLARHGVDDVLVPQAMQDSEGLLAHPALADVRGRAVAVVGAPGGRGVLQRRLRERGARIVDVSVYRRVPARLDRRHRQALRHLRRRHYVLLSSVETLRCLQAALAGADWRRITAGVAVVSSARVAAAARRAGFARVAQAGSALGGALLAQTLALEAAG